MTTPVETVSLRIGNGTLTVPAADLAKAWIERELSASRSTQQASTTSVDLPAIGRKWRDGIYAGITLYDNAPQALILVHGEFRGRWGDAISWARQQGGELPSRVDGLVLCATMKGEFGSDWYWTSEPCAGYADYAWIQSFSYGNQSYYRKSDLYRARVVRRVPILPFTDSPIRSH